MAIDGPSGSGKSTISRGVAAALNLEVLDTGAMYRAVAYAVLKAGIDATDADATAHVARSATITLDQGTTNLDGEDISTVIRGPEVTTLVSIVAAHPPVRAELVRRQRAWAEAHGGGVVEGRDIGSVVFPDARVKVFLTASDDERARRRHLEEAAADREVSVAAVQAAMARRDDADSTRAVSPLRSVDGALHIDTTGRSPGDIVAEIVTAFTAIEGAT